MINLPDSATSSRTLRRQSGFIMMAGVLAIFVAACVFLSLHRAPWWDEGIYADSSSNLALKGFFGSTRWHSYIPGLVPNLPALGQYTYWSTPLYLVSLAGVFRTFGFSIVAMRAWSIWWGCVLIVSWYFIVLALTRGSRRAGLLAAAFVGTDATIILAASTGRADCMVAALGAAGMACYLQLRQSRMNLAILAGASLEVAAIFSHPIAAIHVGTAVLMVLILDWRQLRVRHLFLAALPLLVAFLGWGAYIAQAPEVFKAQFLGHISHRAGGLSSPLRALLTEFQGRYLLYYWTEYHGVTKLKVLFLASYVASCVFLLAAPGIRRRAPGLRLLAVLAVTAYVLLALFDPIRGPVYLIHTFSYLAAAFGATVWWLTQEPGPRKLYVAAATALALLQLSGIAYKIRQDTTANIYRPVVEYVRAHAPADGFVIGPNELLFGLGPQFGFQDDPRLGLGTARAPDMIIRGPFAIAARDIEREEPQTAQFVRERLTHEYRIVFENEEYQLYQRDEKN